MNNVGWLKWLATISTKSMCLVPFVKLDVPQRLLKEPYGMLLADSKGMSTGSVRMSSDALVILIEGRMSLI